MSIQKLKSIIEQSKDIVFLGGAGVSTESNIPDFRSEQGIYQIQSQYGYPPEIMLSHTFFIEHPTEFFQFYKQTMLYPQAKPNQAHFALAELEDQEKIKAVITQNIDGLHQQAGSKRVLELHGSVYRNHCMDCNLCYELDFIINCNGIPRCSKCGGIIKPDVVLYEEPLDESILNQSIECIVQSDTLIIGGTSLSVYPAAGLVNYYRGDQLILINQSPTPYDHRANLVIKGRIGEVLKQVIDSEIDQIK